MRSWKGDGITGLEVKHFQNKMSCDEIEERCHVIKCKPGLDWTGLHQRPTTVRSIETVPKNMEHWERQQRHQQMKFTKLLEGIQKHWQL
jgi:hypothetical protein